MSDSLEVVCPKCHSDIPFEDIKPSGDVTVCHKCGHSFTFAQAIRGYEPELDLTDPPEGVWYTRTPNGFELGLSTRSIIIACFLVPFTIFWSTRLHGSLFGKGFFYPSALFFALPFLFSTIVLSAASAMTLFGKICVRAEGKAGEVFVGVGPVGYCKKFCWTDVKDIRIELVRGSKGSQYKRILIDGKTKVGIPHMPDSRIGYFLAALRQLRREFFPSPGAVPPKIEEAA